MSHVAAVYRGRVSCTLLTVLRTTTLQGNHDEGFFLDRQRKRRAATAWDQKRSWGAIAMRGTCSRGTTSFMGKKAPPACQNVPTMGIASAAGGAEMLIVAAVIAST